VLFPPSESPAPKVTDILRAKRVSQTISRVTRIRNLFVSARDTARPVDCSRERSMNVANGIVTRVSKTEVGYLCYMRPLKDVLPANADKVLYEFYDVETTQNKRYSDTAKSHVPKLVYVQQFCARCDDVKGVMDLSYVDIGGTHFGTNL